MKKLLLSFVFMLFFLQQAFSQDVIIKRTGDEINGKVTEISPTEVRFTKAEQPGVIYVEPKEAIFMIRFENGTREVFEQPVNTLQQLPSATNPIGLTNTSPEDLYIKGRTDASIYYRGYKTAGTATFITTFLLTPAGLITAIATSTTTPTPINLDYPDSRLFKEKEYARGYQQTAKKIKSRKVWTNFGIGVGAAVVFTLLIASAGQ